MPWYKDFFNKWYLEIYQDTPRFKEKYIQKEVALIRHILSLSKGAKVLDLCSGHGRHTIPLAKAGYQMTALDLNKKFLSILKREAKEQKLDIRIIHSDMKKIPFRNEFNAVINIFTSFGYFANDEENLRVLEQVFKALKPAGKFLLDVVNREWVQKNTPAENKYKTKRYSVLEKIKFNQRTNQGKVDFVIIDEKGKNYSARYTTKLYSLVEMEKMLKQAGFDKIIGLFGNTVKIEKFTPRSKRLVILAQK